MPHFACFFNLKAFFSRFLWEIMFKQLRNDLMLNELRNGPKTRVFAAEWFADENRTKPERGFVKNICMRR